MKTGLQKIVQYIPDRRILDERPAFDGDISQPLFHKGSEVGCITLHGIGGTPANIRVVADALIAEGYTVLSPTLPGHGQTVRALNASTDRQWVACVLDAYERLKAEGCTQVYALGLSLGGILAATLATVRPLDGLALICAPIEMQRFLHTARRISLFVPFIRYPDEEDEKNAWRANPYAQMYNGFSTLKLRDLNRLCRRLRKNLDKIHCPTLWFTARYDDKVAPNSKEIFQSGAVNVPEFSDIYLENSPHGCTYGPEKELVAMRAREFVRALVDKRAACPV